MRQQYRYCLDGMVATVSSTGSSHLARGHWPSDRRVSIMQYICSSSRKCVVIYILWVAAKKTGIYKRNCISKLWNFRS